MRLKIFKSRKFNLVHSKTIEFARNFVYSFTEHLKSRIFFKNIFKLLSSLANIYIKTVYLKSMLNS